MKKNLSFDFRVLSTNTRFFWVLVFCIISGFLLPFFLYFGNAISSLGHTYDAFWFYNSNTRALSFAFSVSLSLFAVLGNATIYLEESRFVSNIFTRCKKRSYYISKFIVTFFSGFLITFTFLVLNYLNTYLLIGANKVNISYNIFVVKVNNPFLTNAMYVFPKLWASNPNLNIACYILLYSILSGFISYATFGLSLVIQNRIIVYLGATLFALLTAAIFNIISSPIQLWYWINVFDPFPLTRYDTPATIYLAIMISWFFILFCFGLFTSNYNNRQDVI